MSAVGREPKKARRLSDSIGKPRTTMTQSDVPPDRKGLSARQESGPPEKPRGGREHRSSWRCEGARGCAGAGARGSGIMLCTMRKPLVADGAGDHCLPKLVSPALYTCLSCGYTDCSVGRCSLRDIQHKGTRRPPQCAGNCPCALSVSASTVRLGQDRRECGRAMRQQDNRGWAAYYIAA